MGFDDLVSVRRGELVIPPLSTKPETVTAEWIKIQGVGGEWCCRFLDPTSNACSVYTNRPYSCRALKCWDTDEILSMAGRDLLSRFELIGSNDPLLPLVQLQETMSPVPDMENILARLAEGGGRGPLLEELGCLVDADLKIRSQAASKFNISVARELFYFGRPLYQLFHPLGIVTTETSRGIELKFIPH